MVIYFKFNKCSIFKQLKTKKYTKQILNNSTKLLMNQH